MRTRVEALLILLGVVAVPSAVLVFHFARMSLQPPRLTSARVVAIAARAAKFHADRDSIDLRNAHGTGQFSLRDTEVRCRVGDLVPVEQRGVTLTPVAETCR